MLFFQNTAEPSLDGRSRTMQMLECSHFRQTIVCFAVVGEEGLIAVARAMASLENTEAEQMFMKFGAG